MAKKSLGQNFLVDDHAIRIILAAVPNDAHTIFEIGPGKGALSLELTHQCELLLLLEKDEALLAGTRTRLKIEKGAQLHTWAGDALEFDFGRIWQETAAANDITVVSNLPYNVATEILFRLLPWRGRIQTMILMFQEEVARRISAKNGTKAYGAISVLTQIYFEVEHLLKLGPGSFHPRPKVDSGVLRLERRESPLIDITPEEWPHFSEFVHLFFRQRRKTLLNSLHHNISELSGAKNYDKDELVAKLAQVGLEGSERAETLPIRTIFKLFQTLIN